MPKTLLNRILLVFVLLIVLLPILLCGGLTFVDEHLSAYTYLSQLANVPTRQLSVEDVRIQLLKRIPVGTPEGAIYTILEAYGIAQDRFMGGQWMRYQPKNADHVILGLLSDPPYSWTLFCTNVGFIIRFHLDNHDQLQDITVESTARCGYS